MIVHRHQEKFVTARPLCPSQSPTMYIFDSLSEGRAVIRFHSTLVFLLLSQSNSSPGFCYSVRYHCSCACCSKQAGLVEMNRRFFLSFFFKATHSNAQSVRPPSGSEYFFFSLSLHLEPWSCSWGDSSTKGMAANDYWIGGGESTCQPRLLVSATAVRLCWVVQEMR